MKVEDKQGGRSRKGRQAEARRNDQSVLDAARLVFAVHGPDAAVSAVAARAGVGIGGLYRRYASKDELLQQLCRDSMAQQIAAAETALVSDEGPWDALAGFIRACVSFRAGALSVIAGTIPVTEEMIAEAQRAHELLELLVTRARQAGALRPDVESVDLNQLIELFSRRRPDEESAYRRLLALALDGLRTSGTEPLPGAALTWESYARRWSPG
jgi:AcrR family transcriptional regulator